MGIQAPQFLRGSLITVCIRNKHIIIFCYNYFQTQYIGNEIWENYSGFAETDDTVTVKPIGIINWDNLRNFLCHKFMQAFTNRSCKLKALKSPRYTRKSKVGKYYFYSRLFIQRHVRWNFYSHTRYAWICLDAVVLPSTYTILSA